MKKIAAVFIILFFGTFSFSFSQGKEFYKGIQTLSPVLGLNSYTVPVGVNFEYGVTKNIGIGGTAMLWWWADNYWSNSLIGLSFDGAYHFTGLDVKNLDLFAGAGLGFSIYSYKLKESHPGDIKGGSGSSGLYLEPFIGARYYFNQKIAVFSRLYVHFIGDWGGAGGL
ncbi:MAG: hypothetical protein R6V00_09235, partial [Candidatus Aminicenantes bacterium]